MSYLGAPSARCRPPLVHLCKPALQDTLRVPNVHVCAIICQYTMLTLNSTKKHHATWATSWRLTGMFCIPTYLLPSSKFVRSASLDEYSLRTKFRKHQRNWTLVSVLSAVSAEVPAQNVLWLPFTTHEPEKLFTTHYGAWSLLCILQTAPE